MKAMTVGDLRTILKGLPNEAPIGMLHIHDVGSGPTVECKNVSKTRISRDHTPGGVVAASVVFIPDYSDIPEYDQLMDAWQPGSGKD